MTFHAIVWFGMLCAWVAIVLDAKDRHFHIASVIGAYILCAMTLWLFCREMLNAADRTPSPNLGADLKFLVVFLVTVFAVFLGVVVFETRGAIQ